jgi:diaminobutyrate-2-oxoglutarate transaminase
MVSKECLTRASGALGVSAASLGILTPALAGALLPVIGLSGLIIFDLVTFLVGAMFVWHAFLLVEEKKIQNAGVCKVLMESVGSLRGALGFFVDNPKMRILLFYTLLQFALLPVAVELIVPMILANHSSQYLGFVMSFEAAGALGASLLLVLFKQPRHPMLIILLCDAAIAGSILLAGLSTSLGAYCTIAFCTGAACTVSVGCSYALWLTNIPDNKQGSVLVLLSTLSLLSMAVLVLVGGLVIEIVLEPALLDGGVLAVPLGSWFGVGKGRGTALMFCIIGAVGLAVTFAGLSRRSFRELR